MLLILKEMRKLLLSMILLLAAVTATSQVTIDQKIDTMQILIGEQTNMTVSVTLRKGQSIKFPSFTKSQSITPGVEVLECSSPDSAMLDDGMMRVTRSYRLTSFDERVYSIPSLSVMVGGKKYATKPLALKVLTVPVDTAHVDKFYPPKDVQNNPFSWNEWFHVFMYSSLFVIALVLAFYLVSRLKAGKPVVRTIKIVKRVPAHLTAITKIEKLKAANVFHSENQKEYYTELTSILRQYIAERFGFDAMEMTSSQIIERLRNEGNGAVEEVINLFRTADLVKFAKHTVLINENDQNLLNALSFVNDTKAEEKAPVKVVTTESPNTKFNSRRTFLEVAIGIAIAVAVIAFFVAAYRMYVIL